MIKQASIPLDQLLFKTAFFQNIDKLKDMRGGLYRNFTRRAYLAIDQYWWNKDHSDWKITIEHPLESKDSATPDYWMDRALDLCEQEATHEVFGLTFNDLMGLDPATFEKIEKRVYDYERREAERQKPLTDLKKGMKI